MNWYFEQQGVSHGPLPENDLVLMLRRREITAQTLIWHPGLELWQEIAALKPEWLVTPGVAAPVEKPAPVKEKKQEKPAPKTVSATPATAAKEQGTLVETPVQAGMPAPQSKAAPILKPYVKGEEPTKPPPVEEEKPGLFKKLFGRGKKKT